jgi:hypothetical protein
LTSAEKTSYSALLFLIMGRFFAPALRMREETLAWSEPEIRPSALRLKNQGETWVSLPTLAWRDWRELGL